MKNTDNEKHEQEPPLSEPLSRGCSEEMEQAFAFGLAVGIFLVLFGEALRKNLGVEIKM